MSHGADPGPHVTRRELLRAAGLLVCAAAGASLLAACGNSGSEQSDASASTAGRSVTLYRQEGCTCCVTYADYLRENGFTVDTNTLDDLGPIRRKHKIPDSGVGCHTSLVDGYVVEGHVPVEAIERLLSERPAVDGISVVGMPLSSPGMGEPNGTPLDVVSFRAGRVTDYMTVTTF